MKLYKIIDELYEENKDKFNSKKEVERIVNAYLRVIRQRLVKPHECTFDGIGIIKLTPKGKKKIKAAEKKKLLTRQAYIRYHCKYVRRAWRHGFIDDSFPD